MTSPPCPSNLIDFNSPSEAISKDVSGHQSLENNTFDDCRDSPFKMFNVSVKDSNRPSLVSLDLNSSDFLARESLGILPTTALCRESLTAGLSHMSVKQFLNNSSLSPRESLGVLNLSSLDLGRESIDLFNIQNSFLRRKSLGNEQKENLSLNLGDFNFDNIENGLKTVKKSPLQTENLIPELILSTSTTQDKLNSFSLSALNNAFILPHSRILSAVSSGSSSVNPYFNSRSLEEPSKISLCSPYKNIRMSQSVLTTTDPFNEAFHVSAGDNNIHSVSQILTSTRRKDSNSFLSHIENVRNRIQSLPVALEDINILADLDLETKNSNISFPDAMICRGVEDDGEFEDSVFVEARKVASLIADTSFNPDEKSFDSNQHNILDATPQPEWPTDLDSPQSHLEDKAKSPKCNKDDILKQVDRMLGMQPVNLEEKLNSKSGGKNDSTSPENISQNLSKISRTSPGNNAENQSYASNNFSQNISKISRTSPESNKEDQSCASNNFSQNLSKIMQTSDENASRLIQNLSDILKDNENLSQTQKKEGRQMLQRLASMLCDSKSKSSSSAEDSGHSSVDEQHLEGSKNVKNYDKNELKTAVAADSGEALDLSCKGKSCSSEINKRLSISKSPAPSRLSSPHLSQTPICIATTNASSASITSNTSDTNKSKVKHSNASNCSNASAKSGNVSSASRHSNISQGKVSLGAGKLRKSKLGVVITKKGPLRAVLPVENMAKGNKSQAKGADEPVTPDKKEGGLKFGLSSKKTSTPIQEPKLKPMAASTPANRQSKDSREPAGSLAKPKYTRSFSYQPQASGASEQSERCKNRDSTSSTSKTGVNKLRSRVESTKLVRRNSITEGVLNPQKDIEGPIRIKRSFSTGKEPKILSALNRVRQNILNSPYYNPKKSIGSGQGDLSTENLRELGTDLKRCGQELKKLSMISQQKKPGKENVKR